MHKCAECGQPFVGMPEVDEACSNCGSLARVFSTDPGELAADAVLAELRERKGVGDVLDLIDEETYVELFVACAAAARKEIPIARTCAQLTQAMIQRIGDARDAAFAATSMRGDEYDRAAREYALAITHAEDSLMRFTRGKAHELGVFKPADLEDEEAVRERHEWTGRALEQMDARDEQDV